MTKHTVTVVCDRCGGVGVIAGPGTAEWNEGPMTCPSCLGQCHVETDVPQMPTPMTNNEAFIYVCATRYALNRQTYAGGIVIEELLRVVDRMPYADRKRLEQEVSDALFKGEVDPLTREAWENLVTDIQRVEGT